MNRIVAVEIFEQTIPFADGGGGKNMVPGQRWDRFDTVLLRIETEDGSHGWGESFAYACRGAVVACLREMVVPLLLGQDAADPPGLMEQVQRRLHLFGRYGILCFAISGVDIALWDLRARGEGVPLASLLGPSRRADIECYASLVRYGTPALVRRMAAQAVANGYRAVKLHEIDPDAIEAGRDGAGPDAHLTIDANCAWSHAEVVALAPRLRAVRPAWIEEPIYPPEDFLGLAALGRGTGIAMAAGENNCTRHQFAAMIRDGAVTFPQPSVTKIGGVTEFMATVALADLTCMPHSPYFGPGYFYHAAVAGGNAGRAAVRVTLCQASRVRRAEHAAAQRRPYCDSDRPRHRLHPRSCRLRTFHGQPVALRCVIPVLDKLDSGLSQRGARVIHRWRTCRSACATQFWITCANGSNSRARSDGLRPERTRSTIWRRNSGKYGGRVFGMTTPVAKASGVSIKPALPDFDIGGEFDRVLTTEE